MIKPDGPRAWLVSYWPLLRIAMQLSVALAMIAQRGSLALLLGGAALLLETVQDRLTVDRCRCARCHCEENLGG